MRRYHSFPLFFLFAAAAIGLFLRWQFIHPTAGTRYSFFLHAHSHVMFLGWVFNVLYLAFVEHHLGHVDQKPFRKVFLLLQALVLAMLISFPIQGYGVFSIVFSTLHTLAAAAFIFVFFRLTRGQVGVSVWFARISLFFFLLSAAGPLSLGFMMANGLGDTVWYNFSIYYYLHFQYNGCFTFGVISLFYQLLERKEIEFDRTSAISFGRWMAIACVPAYALSILSAKPGLLFNVAGSMAAVVQVFALWLFLRELKRINTSVKARFDRTVYIVLQVILAAFALKLLLQLASGHPLVARMAWELRPVVIAYLHLVLLGIITPFFLAWYMERYALWKSPARMSFALLLSGFIGSQLVMIMTPWWNTLAGGLLPPPAPLIFAFSVLLVAGISVFCLSFLKKADKNQLSR